MFTVTDVDTRSTLIYYQLTYFLYRDLLQLRLLVKPSACNPVVNSDLILAVALTSLEK